MIKSHHHWKPQAVKRGKAVKALGSFGIGPKGSWGRVKAGMVIVGRGEGKVMVNPVGAVISR